MKSFFVSSTFRDMQEERDVIHRIVFPSVRNKLKKYGETAEEVDLRWGVDTLNLSEEESGHMVIRVCIDAIDRCVPYFIVLLGERYGWIPEQHLLEGMKDERLKNIGTNISITEMEIRYGSLDRKMDKEHCIYCFRNASLLEKLPAEYKKDYEAESEIHKAKLDELKMCIRQMESANILEYEAEWDEQNGKVCGLETFAEKLENMLMEIMRKEGLSEAAICEEERITQNALFTMRQQLRNYVTRGSLEAIVPVVFVNKKHQWFRGKQGSGKTTFLSFVANQSIEKGRNVLLYYGGAPGCESADVFLRWLGYELEKKCGKHLKELAYDRRLAIKKIEELSRHLAGHHIVFVDAVDQMSEDMVWVLTQLAVNVKNIQFFVTSANALQDYDVKEAEELFVKRRVQELVPAECELIIDKTAGRRGKKLDIRVLKKLRDMEHAKSPLHLSLILQRLFMMDGAEFAKAEKLAPGMKGISLYMEELLDALGETPEELVLSVVGKALDSMEMNVDALGYLAVSPEGLTVRMLTELCEGITSLQMQQLMFFLYDILEETKDGRWVFKHPLVKEYVRTLFSYEKICAYESHLYQKCMIWNTCKWSERIELAKRLENVEIGVALENALLNETLTDREVWSEMEKNAGNKTFLLKLAQKTNGERYLQCLVKGIAKYEISFSEETHSFIETIAEKVCTGEGKVYLWKAQKNISTANEDYPKMMEDMEQMYQRYCELESPSGDVIWDMSKDGFSLACSADISVAKKWQERLRKIETDFSKYVDDTNYYLLLNEKQVWAWKLLKYREEGSEERLTELKSFFDSVYRVCKLHNDMNLFEQDSPGFNAENMRSISGYSGMLADIYLRKKMYSEAFAYAKIAYNHNKKDYQLCRTLKSADIFAYSCMQMVQCVKKEYKERYYIEGVQALEWSEKQYLCKGVEENLHGLHSIYARGTDNLEAWENAILTAKKLAETFPGVRYKEYILWDYRKHKYLLCQVNEHIFATKILEEEDQIRYYANYLYECTKDEYFLSNLFEYESEMVELCAMQGMYSAAEQHLRKAESYLKCAYIQNGEQLWDAETSLVMSGASLYYRIGEKEKWTQYVERAEMLLVNERERNRSQMCKVRGILWEERVEYQKLRMLWEETKDISLVKPKVQAYLERASKKIDENEMRPARLLMGEIEHWDGNYEKSRAYFKMVCSEKGKNLPWEFQIDFTEYQIWQYIMAVKAMLFLYEETGEKHFLTDVLFAIKRIMSATRDCNAKYRPIVGEMLMHVFDNYEDKLCWEKCGYEIGCLLIWMKSESEERELTQKELHKIAKWFQHRLSEKDIYEQDKKEADELETWIDGLMERYPDKDIWGEIVRKKVLRKAVRECMHNRYREAWNMLEQIDVKNETAILLEICKVKNGAMLEMSEQCSVYMELMEGKIENKERIDGCSRYLYFELLAQKNDEESCRKAADYLEKQIINEKYEISTLWKKAYALRRKCISYSEVNPDSELYLEDCKKARLAYASFSGNSKEELMELLKWNEKIASLYERRDTIEELKWRRIVSNTLVYCLIKKHLLTKEELEQYETFYKKVLCKIKGQKGIHSIDMSLFMELPYELYMELYEKTNDKKWLDKLLDAQNEARECLLLVTDESKEFGTTKIAESYKWDMDVYQILLSKTHDEQLEKDFIMVGRKWLEQIPGYYKEFLKNAINALKMLDEMLEGKCVELKILIQEFMAKEDGNENDISWYLTEIYEEYGADLDSDKARMLLKEKMKSM